MAFSPLPSSLEEALKEIKMWREKYRAQPMHPEIKKMYEDYFDKCFRESSPAQQEPVYHPRQYGDVTGAKEVRTLQAQRTWVGLTDAEVEDFVSALWPVGAGAGKLLRDIEVKLREKNNG